MKWPKFLLKKKKLDPRTVQPYMTDEEVEIIKTFLGNFAPERELRVFEYGSGGSSIYFPRFLEARGVKFQWLALEHDLTWAADVLRMLNEARLRTVQLLVCSVPGVTPMRLNTRPIRVKLMAKGVRFDYSNYTDTPRRLGGGYDVVIVDGRDRKNCLHMGYSVLNPGGIVFVHDAERDYYQCAFQKYPTGSHLTRRLWAVRKEA